MGAGWIPTGSAPAPDAAPSAAPPDQDPWSTVKTEDAPAGIENPWAVTGQTDANAPALIRPHQNPTASPIENTRSLYARTKGLLFGHEPENSQDPDQRYAPGLLPAVADSTKDLFNGETPGPSWGTIGRSLPHLYGAQAEALTGGVQEALGAHETNAAERRLAALNVLPQVAARTPGADAGAKIQAMAADPLVQKTARQLGVDPKVFATDYAQIAGLSNTQQAQAASRAQADLQSGAAHVVSGRGHRNQAWADTRVWQPSDRLSEPLEPWSVKGAAFNLALMAPQVAAITAASLGGGAVGGPAGAMAAGGATATALMAPAQRGHAKDTVDDQVHATLQQADQTSDPAIRDQLRQKAADLAANADKIADTYALFSGVADAAGALPVAAVLSRAPAGQAILNRIVGSALQRTVGGRIAAQAASIGAGGVFQAALQKGIDAGIIHENTTLADALKDIGYSGLMSAVMGAGIAAPHELMAARAARPSPAETLARGWRPTGPLPGREVPGQIAPEVPRETPVHGADIAPPGPPTATSDPGNATSDQQGQPPTGAPAQRAAHQEKIDTLNQAAAAAEKRSDITLEPEEDGWSVHVKGQAVAQFDSAVTAREAIAQARKLVGTVPAAKAPPAPPAPPAASPPTPTVAETPETAPSSEGAGLATAAPERRQDVAQRKAVSEMTPAELRQTLLTHELTGIPNRRAFEEAPKKPFQVSVDSDGLKAINDIGGHEAGDQALKLTAQALHAEDPANVFHISGDEFKVQAEDEEAAHALMARVNDRLKSATIEVTMPDGQVFHVPGLGVSYGVGRSSDEAEGNLQTSKSERQAQGLRAPRGELPPGATVRAREAGGPDHGGQTRPQGPVSLPGEGAGGRGTTQVLGQTVDKPALPTPAQAKAGNYFKPTVDFHGLTLRLENERGGTRHGVAKSGKKWSQRMAAHYGYVQGSTASDQDGVDVFMGPHPEATHAYVIDQTTPDGRHYDEAKSIVGVKSEAEARALYLKHYPPGWKGLGAITEMPIEHFKAWAHSPEAKHPIAWKKPLEAHLAHPETLERLRQMTHETGWDQVGGQLIRNKPDDDVGLKPEVVGRTPWIPRAPWFAELAERLPGKARQYREALEAAEKGEKLSALERRVLTDMAQMAQAHVAAAQPMSDEALDQASPEALEARLAAYEAEAERQAIQAESAESEAPLSVASRPARYAAQPDLFGDRVAVRNEIERLKAALDHKRNTGQVSVETGDAGDLLSQARRQLELSVKQGTFRAANAYRNTQIQLNFGGAPAAKPSFVTRPDTTPADVVRGLSALLSLRDLRAGARVLGDHLPQAFIDHGTVSLVGQEIGDIHDVALLAQANRRPDFEVLHFVLTAAGRVVHDTAMTSRLPNAARFGFMKGDEYPHQTLKALMAEHGADGYWMYHNHPSGRSDPSSADLVLTHQVAYHVPGFQGHVVIDTNEYSIIQLRAESIRFAKKGSWDQGVRKQRFPIENQAWAVGLSEPRVAHTLLGRRLATPEQLAQAASQIGSPADQVTIISASVSDIHSSVRSITTLPRELTNYHGARGRFSRLRVLARLRALGTRSGSAFLYAIVPDEAAANGLPPIFRDVLIAGDSRSQAEKGINTYRVGPALGRSANSNEAYRLGEPPAAEPPFFSQLARNVEAAKREKGTGAEWEATLRNMPGTKPEEMQWVGLKDWLAGRGRVSKQEVAEFVRANQIQIGESLHGTPETGEIKAQLKHLGYHVGEYDDGSPQLIHMSDGTDVSQWPIVGEGNGHEELPAAVDALFKRLYTGDAQAPKFPTHVLPGGQNYRELLLTLPLSGPAAVHGRIEELPNGKFLVSAPSLQNRLFNTQAEAIAETQRLGRLFEKQPASIYHSNHWEEPNVLAHVRFDERTGSQGERVLHIAEVQSDWHQQGRKQGYRPSDDQHARKLAAIEAEMKRIGNSALPADRNRWQELNREHWALERSTAQIIPDAPFKTTWPELAMKRMIRYAAEHGYDALSWDTGQTNADRYDLSKQASSIHWFTYPHSEFGALLVKGTEPHQPVILERSLKATELPDMIGKEAAERLLKSESQGLTVAGQEHRMLQGEDLKVGGSGMRAFYDKMLPVAVGKLVKRFGGQVEKGIVPTYREGRPIGGDDGAGGVIRERIAGEAPAHIVKITAAMHEAAMSGFAVMDKPGKYGAATEPEPPEGQGAVRSGYELARRAVAAIPNNEFSMAFRRIADPAGVSESSEAVALRAREAFGELAHSSEEALKSLEQYAKTFDLLSPDDRYAFIDAMETGARQPIGAHQAAADTIRKALDAWREKIQSLGIGALDNFIEHYFPHIWNDPKGAAQVFGQIFGRRPLKGPASFLKQRTIPTTKEGVEKGLTPVSTNPLILAFAKLREMQKFYAGVKLMQRFKDEKLAVFLPSQRPMPAGWAEIDDAVGRVRQWSEIEQGFIERGRYIMPTDAARVINNHLSASALANFLPAQLFRAVSNAANALQLGFSAFHLGFTTLDAIISKNALGVERLLHGEPIRAAQAFLEGLTGPVAAGLNIRRGMQLLKAYSNIGGATPEMQRIVEGLMAAGGRVKMDRYFLASQGSSPFRGVGFAHLIHEIRAVMTLPAHRIEEMGKVIGSFPAQYATKLWRDLQDMSATNPGLMKLTLPFEVAGRVTRASTSIIMEHVVPLQKLGVFADLAADHIRRNPGQEPVGFARAMQLIWNSIDNRLGEMVYDNVFWARTFKDVLHMIIRAVGWNLGTVREIGGAFIDMVKVLDYMARGAPPDEAGAQDYRKTWQRVAEKFGHKIPYVIAMTATTMLTAATLQYLLTGEGPKELKDYFFPRTGRLTKYGTPERISLPAYVKDIFEYWHAPGATVVNKANPIFGIAHSIYANEDFFGNAIRNPDAGFWAQALEGAQYAAREVLPFAIQGGKQFHDAGATDVRGKFLTIAPYVGLTPAPAKITSPEQMERYEHRQEEQSYLRGLNRRLRAAQEGNATPAAIQALREEVRQEKMKLHDTQREIKTDKVRAHQAQTSAVLDTSRYALRPDDPAANPAHWDQRADGSDKGQGFLGLLKRPDGRVSSEISVGVEIDGQEREIPTLVPTLSQDQLDYLMTHPVGEGHPLPEAIIQKAVDFARQRLARGLSPFAGPNDTQRLRSQQAADRIGALIQGKDKATAVAALQAAGLPAFAQLWHALPDRPRPRVAQSLEAFA